MRNKRTVGETPCDIEVPASHSRLLEPPGQPRHHLVILVYAGSGRGHVEGPLPVHEPEDR